MKYAPLPVIEQLQTLPEKEAIELRDRMIEDFRRHPSAQLLASLLQSIESNAIRDMASADTNKILHAAGRMAAVNTIRDTLVQLIPTKESSEPEPSDLVEEEFLGYDHPFGLPVSGSQE